MPYAYGYARVSHKDQVDGESIAGQTKRGRQYWDAYLKDQGIEWGVMVEEPENVSASKVSFKSRKGGARLMKLLRPGDHVIFDKIDRVWRSVRDFVELQQWFIANDVTFHITNLMGCSLKSGTPMGNFMLNLLVSVAELESAQISDRIKSALHHQRQEGLHRYQQDPNIPGLVFVEAVPQKLSRLGSPLKMFAWDYATRAINKRIVELRDGVFSGYDEHEAFRQISDLIHAAYGDNRPFVYRDNRFWKPKRCRFAYVLETEIYPAVLDPRFLDIKSLLKLSSWKNLQW